MDTKPMGSFSPDAIRDRPTMPETDSAIGRVTERVKVASNDVLLKVKDIGHRIPQNVTEAGRALDGHVHDHARLDVAIVGGAGLVLGALFGRRFLRFAMLVSGAIVIARMYPQIEPYLRKKIEEW